jgi:hypothetical protein
MKNVGAVLVFVFIIFFAIYLVWTGSVNPTKFDVDWHVFFPSGGDLFPKPSSSSQPTNSAYSYPPDPEDNQYQAGNQTPTYFESDIPSGYTASQLSPYFHKVRIGSVSAGFYNAYGQISLYAYFQNPDDFAFVSGWTLKANRGSQIIPRAVEIYEPHGLTPEGDIYLKSGDYLYIYTNTSAISRNLRLNKCIGYLENTNNFTPPLFQSCPYITRQEVASFTGQCQNYILSLGSCRIPAANPPIPPDDYACRSFMENINYGGCYSRHRSDPDFLGREWRVWTNSRFLDQQHDTLRLLDSDGLLVDLYSY